MPGRRAPRLCAAPRCCRSSCRRAPRRQHSRRAPQTSEGDLWPAEPRRRRPAAAPRRRRSSRPQPTTRAGRRAARSGAEPPRGPPLLAPCAAHLAASRRASTPEARRSRRPTPSHSRPETMSHLRRPSCSAVDPAARHSPYHVMLPPCARPSCAPLTSPVPPRFLLLAGWPEARFLASSGLEAQTRAPRGEKSRSSQDQGARWRPEVTKSGCCSHRQTDRQTEKRGP